jgi:hypothetical protein
LAYSNGVLYALTGYQSDPLEVFGLNPLTGAVVSGPVSIIGPAGTASASNGTDGFTVLPNGNFFLNEGDDTCTYDQYNPSTGLVIPGTTIVNPACPGNPKPGLGSTGVETDGTSLFFQTNFNSFTQTTLSGTLVATQVVSTPPADQCEDISLVQSLCFGAPGATPGKPNCHGKCVSFLAKTFGGIDEASSDFGYASVSDLQDAIRDFCEG